MSRLSFFSRCPCLAWIPTPFIKDACLCMVLQKITSYQIHHLASETMVGVQHLVQHLENSKMEQPQNGAPSQKPMQTLISEDPRILWVPTTTDYHEVVVYIRSGFNGKEIIVQSARPVVACHIEDEARTANRPPSPELTDTTAGASEKSNSTSSDQSVPTPDPLFQEADDDELRATRSWMKLLLVIGVMTLVLLLAAAGIVAKVKTRSPSLMSSLTKNEPKAAGLTLDVPAMFEALSHKDEAVADELKAIQDVLYSSKAGITSPSLLVETDDEEAYDFGQLLEQLNKVKDIDRALMMFWFARDDATAMCGNMLRKRILSSDAYEILVNQSM